MLLICFEEPHCFRHAIGGLVCLQTASVISFLDGARNREIPVDLRGCGIYPDVIRVSGMRPDIGLHSRLRKQVVLCC